MPPSPVALAAAPWWAEFLAVRDELSWAVLADRFGTSDANLKRALVEAGLTKKPLPPGRKPKSPPPEPPAPQPVQTTPAGPEALLRRLVGKQPDGEVAEAAGVSLEEVKAFRRAHSIAGYLRPPPGISSPLPPVDAPAQPAPAPSGVIVRRTGAPGQPVQEVRRAVVAPVDGEPASRERPGGSGGAARPPLSSVAAPVAREPASPTPPVRSAGLERFKAELGTVGDHVIAERAGVSIGNVAKFRRDHGIPAYDGFRKGPRKKQSAPVVAKQNTPASARPRAADSAPRVGRRSVLDAYVDVLGTVPDGVVAAMAGVSRDAAKLYRHRHGIGRFVSPRSHAPVKDQLPYPEPPLPVVVPPEPTAPTPEVATSKRGRTSKIEPFADLVGVLPDRTIAQRAGTTVGSVQVWRSRRGIPSPAGSTPVTEVLSIAAPEAVSTREQPPAGLPASEPPVVVLSDAPLAPLVQPIEAEAGPAAPSEAPDEPEVELAGEPNLPSMTAYRLRAARGAELRDFYIVADDIGDAGVRAIAALSRNGGGPWRVVAIRELGEALE